MSNAKILIIDDDINICELLRLYLEKDGFEAEVVTDGLKALDAFNSIHPDLVLLDIMLPGMDGIEILTKMKESAELRSVPVIMATAKGTEFDKVQSLDLGADDYLVKPFGMMEMVSRVKAVLRRCKPREDVGLLRLDELVLNKNEHTVTISGERINLTYKEYELLKLFMSNPGVAFNREKLLQKVWNTDYVAESRTVDMHIRTLRQKLGSYGSVIETIRNVGYRLEKKP